MRQRGGKSDVALTTEDETSNLLSPLGKRKGAEVVQFLIEAIHSWPHINKSLLPLFQLCPFFSLSARACASPSTRPPTPPFLLARCLSSWISFWITPSPLLVPSSLSTLFFVHYISSAFLHSAISLVPGMRQYLTFGSRHTSSASNNVELSTRCSQNTVPLCASARTRWSSTISPLRGTSTLFSSLTRARITRVS